MSEHISIKVIMGSTREGRFSDKPAAWITGELKKQDGLAVEILDLRDYVMPFFDAVETPAYKQAPYTNEVVKKFTAKIAEGDTYIIVTPEYNHSVPAVLKNAMDWVYQEWNNKPVGFVSYGSVGGARAVEQLRLTAIELQMAPIRESVHFPGNVYFPVLFGKAEAGDMFAKETDQAQKMITQLLWWARALKNAR